MAKRIGKAQLMYLSKKVIIEAIRLREATDKTIHDWSKTCPLSTLLTGIYGEQYTVGVTRAHPYHGGSMKPEFLLGAAAQRVVKNFDGKDTRSLVKPQHVRLYEV